MNEAAKNTVEMFVWLGAMLLFGVFFGLDVHNQRGLFTIAVDLLFFVVSYVQVRRHWDEV